MQSDNCKEFYQAAFDLLETVMVRIELSPMSPLVNNTRASMRSMTDRALAKNPASISASCAVVSEASADGHGTLVNHSS